MTEQAPPNSQDSALLHFLKELPAWVVMVFVFMTMLGVHQVHQFDFMPRLLDQAFGGILTALVTGRRTNNTNVSADTVETPQITTTSMDQSTIHADNLQMDNAPIDGADDPEANKENA